jgi:predicted Zn-dependent protease with MMP-like domain
MFPCPLQLSEIMTLSDAQLSELIDNYANHVIDGMDMDTLVQFAYDSLVAEFNKYTEAELIAEVQELYGDELVNDLLESVK